MIKPIPEFSGDQLHRLHSTIRTGDKNDCWEWMGPRTAAGYGRFIVAIEPKHVVSFYAHRVVASITGMDTSRLICHHCDNPPCCNPAHLFSGSDADNMRDAAKKKRVGVLVKPHRYSWVHGPKVVEAIRRAVGTQLEIAGRFSVHQSTVSRIRNRKIWT